MFYIFVIYSKFIREPVNVTRHKTRRAVKPEKPVKRIAAKGKDIPEKNVMPENLELLPDAHKIMCRPCNPKKKEKKKNVFCYT